MAEKAVTKQLETQRSSELNELAGIISYGNIHRGVNITVHRMSELEDEMKERYNLISGPLLHISKQLQRSVSHQLKDKRAGGKQTGLLMGRRLDAHALPRSDGKVFYKNALPNEAPELAVGLLLDESGSMYSCERATYARATAIILYDFCHSLHIPIMVYGHSTDYSRTGQSVVLYSYAEFDDIDGNDRYRLMDISARRNNRDGAALRYAAEQLSRRPEEVKILILVSDGQPADGGYCGTAAEEDLRGVKSEYTKKHILFVAAAIGSDKENIERIYGDSYLDITDLNNLPVALTNVVKRHILV
jgi:nitric oxide reductase activation protein